MILLEGGVFKDFSAWFDNAGLHFKKLWSLVMDILPQIHG